MHSAAKKCAVKQGMQKSKHWWIIECTQAQSKNRFWYRLWRDNDKPTHGVIHECYKASKRQFRKTCRIAQKNCTNRQYNAISCYMKYKNTNKLWAAVKQMKNTKQDMHASKDELREFLCVKFDDPNLDTHAQARENVQIHFTTSSVDKGFGFPEALVKKYILKLKSAAAPGIDGITPDHLKQAVNTSLPLHISALLTLCCRHSLVPESVTQGLIVPLPKAGKDHTTPQGFRPITISVITSKLLEHFVLEQCAGHAHNPLMFGFIPERGTDVAIALAHDVCQHSLARGSAVHLASLDAEGAFDYIPHAVLLDKAINVIPTLSWKIMMTWYSRLQARLMIGRHLDNVDIPIRRGMRQGALTSPMLFNIFYRQLIDTLSRNDAGVIIDNHKYNVFNYAGDVLLASTTVSGLQSLINTATAIISNDGLRFNPAKTAAPQLAHAPTPRSRCGILKECNYAMTDT